MIVEWAQNVAPLSARMVGVGAVREPPLRALHLISLAGSHPTIPQRAACFL